MLRENVPIWLCIRLAEKHFACDHVSQWSQINKKDEKHALYSRGRATHDVKRVVGVDTSLIVQ
jgi:hypothetical protein